MDNCNVNNNEQTKALQLRANKKYNLLWGVLSLFGAFLFHLVNI